MYTFSIFFFVLFIVPLLWIELGYRLDSKYTKIVLRTRGERMCSTGECIQYRMLNWNSKLSWRLISLVWYNSSCRCRCWGKCAVHASLWGPSYTFHTIFFVVVFSFQVKSQTNNSYTSFLFSLFKTNYLLFLLLNSLFYSWSALFLPAV